MRTLLIAVLVVTPSLALADKDFTGGKGTTWDCKTDPAVNINHGKGTYTFKGECKTINVNGGHNTLTIENVTDLNVNGASNTITVATVATINLVGADNKITWKKAKSGDKPTVSTVGDGNKVAQGK